ncbi:BTB/POZ and TAZ domain-containing protein 1 [Dendrobium catenatum]|uniref:BTB/POZ and TAZ domain-containing protein 1 n=1 Tax=Dendrobium catenatum TaxID=906689 RepID=UPI0010A06C41|nr:BTB/POZ and TAZ domain-containing protein 1 [Dendrobium catenatum]
MTILFAKRAEVPQTWKVATVAAIKAAGDGDRHGADAFIQTSTGLRIPAHSNILASMSPVLARVLNLPNKRWKSEKVIRILGVPNEAVLAFVRLLHAGCDEEDEEMMRRNGMHLLYYRSLARPCATRLGWLRCLKLVKKDFGAVQKSDACEFLHESDLREKQSRRNMEEQKTYQQLSEAMECLEHIFKEGCTDIKPDRRRRSSCSCPPLDACQPLQLLLLHFSKCDGNRATCSRCRRIWQLLKLHSSICMAQDSSSCKVPLCRQFKYKMQKMEEKLEERKWMVLGKKVASVVAFSSFAKRKRYESGRDLGPE